LTKSGSQPADIFGEGGNDLTWCCTLQLNMFLKFSVWGKLSGCGPGSDAGTGVHYGGTGVLTWQCYTSK